MLDAQSPEARHIALLWWVMFALSMAVFAVAGGLLLYALFRRRGAPSVFERRAGSQTLFILISGAAVPLVILIVVFGFTVGVMAASRGGEGAMQVEVTGHNFWWEVGYPEAGVTTQNEIHVPAGREIDFVLRSDDVIHSFWAPQLNGKTDLVPGQTNHMSITVTSPGTYRGECAEFCGVGHACMTFEVIAMPQADFDAWLASQPKQRSGDPQEFNNGDCVGRSAGVVERDAGPREEATAR
jgi:cytochrome c oxidase subunit 2